MGPAMSMLWLVKNCPEVFLTPQSPSTVRCYRWTVMAKETRNKLKIIIFTSAHFLNFDLREALKKKTVKKGTLSTRQPQFPFLAQIYRNLSGPQITQKLTQTPWKYNFLSHFFVIFRPFRSLLIQWVQGVWFLIILRAFYIKMSRVAFTHFCR